MLIKGYALSGNVSHMRNNNTIYLDIKIDCHGNIIAEGEMDNGVTIRVLDEGDLDATAAVHQASFVRQQCSKEWLHCNFNAFPRSQLFVAENVKNEITGYILWCQKAGFRSEVVLELEQLAVHPAHQGQGIGTRLILESLPLVQRQLQSRGATVKHIMVTTRADNAAQRLYRKTLNAEVEATVCNLYSADEVVMISRNIAL